MHKLIAISSLDEIPKALTICPTAEVSQVNGILTPILLSSAINMSIRTMPEAGFASIMGLKIFYNLFTMLSIVDTFRKENLRWDERGLKSTNEMVESQLEMKIPMNNIFEPTREETKDE